MREDIHNIQSKFIHILHIIKCRNHIIVDTNHLSLVQDNLSVCYRILFHNATAINIEK